MNRYQREEVLSEKILNYIKDYLSEQGYSPTFRDISSALNIKSISTVHTYVEKLQKKGLLTKISQKNRTLSINNLQQNFQRIPLFGTVTAGTPILAEQNLEEFYDLPNNLFDEKDLFMLKVKGSSMIGAGIFDGDKIVVKPQPYAENGNIVVAIVNDDTATVKRYVNKNNVAILRPENPDFEDIICDNIRIIGIVIGLIRQI